MAKRKGILNVAASLFSLPCVMMDGHSKACIRDGKVPVLDVTVFLLRTTLIFDSARPALQPVTLSLVLHHHAPFPCFIVTATSLSGVTQSFILSFIEKTN